jgi:hypothetical protein
MRMVRAARDTRSRSRVAGGERARVVTQAPTHSPPRPSLTQWVAERSSDVNDASATRRYIAQHESVLYCLSGQGVCVRGCGVAWGPVWSTPARSRPCSQPSPPPPPVAAAELHLEGGQKLVIEGGQSWMVPAACSHTYRVLSEEPFRALEASPLKS